MDPGGAGLPTEVARVAAAALVGMVALAVWRALPAWTLPIADPDQWWVRHIGDVLLSGRIPHVNGLAWTAPDHPWVTHEPLPGLIYALGGPAWVGLARGLVISSTFLLLAWSVWRRESALATLGGLAWALLLLTFGLTERPLSWGNLMLAAVVALTWRPDGGVPGNGRLCAAALVAGLWASVHGSFVVGVALVGLASWRWGLVAALLTLANPNGWHLWELVLGYGGSSGTKPFIHGVLLEWWPPNPLEPDWAFRLALLFGGGALVLIRGPWRARLIWAGLTLLACRHQRFVDLAAIESAPWVARALADRLSKGAMPNPVPWIAGALALLAVASPPARYDEAMFPPTFPFERIKGERVWNDYVAGGWLGVNGVQVFWDQRVDCYPLQVLADGSVIQTDPARRLALFDQWRIGVVVTHDAEMAAQLAKAGWTAEGPYGVWRILRRRG